MTLQAGARLGPYEIVSLLGAGGMGEVYRARDTRLDRVVAVKVLPAELGRDPTSRLRFEREAKAISKLEHERVCRLYDVGAEAGVNYLVMELLDGETLADRLRRGALPLPQVLAIGGQIAAALDAAHTKGIVHRDLKPGNVMLMPSGVKVLDFGLAKGTAEVGACGLDTQAATATQPLTRAGLLVGTLPYMAPEQLQGKPADARSDLWALGCVLYEMTTGERPFRGESQADLVGSIMAAHPEPPTRKRPLAPARLDVVVARCLEKEPARRWLSARELATALEDLANGVESPAAPVTPMTSQAPLPPRWQVEGAGTGASDPRSEELASLQEAARKGVALDRARPHRRWTPAVLVSLLVIVVAAVWLATRDRPAVVGSSATRPADQALAGAEDERPMIVVLPFENLGPPEQAYFAAGMSEAVTSRLARIAELGVISRSSALQYAGGAKSIRQIGEELGVDWVLEGTVLWAGERVRISQRLVRVADATQAWAEDYDKVIDVANLIDVQAEIAERVSRQLGLSLIANAEPTAASLPTTSMDAYHAYLRGVEAWERPFNRNENLLVAAEALATAVELDPAFGEAWALLSQAWTWRYALERTAERRDAARTAAERAHELDPDLAASHSAWGVYYWVVVQDYERAYREYEMAAATLPNDAEVRSSMGSVLAYQGDFVSAAEHFEEASRLDPRNFWPRFWAGNAARYLRHYETADRLFERAIPLGADTSFAYIARASNAALWRGWEAADRVALAGTTEPAETYWRWLVARRLGRSAEALALLDRLPPEGSQAENSALPRDLLRAWILDDTGDREQARQSYQAALLLLEQSIADRPGDDRVESALGLTYAGLGREQDAVRHGEKGLEIRPPWKDAINGPRRLEDLATIYSAVGRPEAALEVLEQLLSIPAPFSVVWMESDPAYAPLRNHPRYRRLVERYR